jgi:hypothetical protein
MHFRCGFIFLICVSVGAFWASGDQELIWERSIDLEIVTAGCNEWALRPT